MIFYITTDRAQLLLIEEPEVCIHHGLLKSVIRLIEQIAKDKQIIISTHSDLVLDLIAPESVYVVKTDGAKGIKVNSLKDALPQQGKAALKDYLENTGNLGEYYRQGGLSDAI